MNKKILISIISIIIIVITCAIIIYGPENKETVQNKISENTVTEDEISDTEKTVEDLKTEIGATASEEIYEIQKEYDGREILTIKPDVQFETVLAGILKNGKPSTQDIENLDLSEFHKGVWISELSRDKFLKMLKKCNIENFEIDKTGYLYKNSESDNKYSSKLEKLINSDELTIIDITGTCYIRDEMTGDIVEYPFKDMDLYQICERYDTEGASIIIITTNNVEEFDILDAICE